MLQKNIVIAGGSGFLGTAVANHFKSKHHNVQILSRLKTEATMAYSDPLPKNTDIVINFAGVPVLNPLKRWGPYQTEIKTSRFDTANILAKAIHSMHTPPQVFIQVSGIGYYPSTNSKDLSSKIWNEDLEPPSQEISYWPKFTKDWENSSKIQPSKTRQIFLRTAPVLAKNGGMLSQLSIPFRIGLGGPIGSGKQPFSWIHIADYINLIDHLVFKSTVSGGVIAASPGVTTNKEFSTVLGKKISVTGLAVVPLPKFAVDLVFGKVRGEMLLEGSVVYPKRSIESGFKFEFEDIEKAIDNIY